MLFFSGVLVSTAFRANPIMTGVAVVAFLPAFMFIEILINPSSHNLFPLELLVYGALALVVCVGGCMGFIFKRFRWTSR